MNDRFAPETAAKQTVPKGRFEGAYFCQQCAMVFDGIGAPSRCPSDGTKLTYIDPNPFGDCDIARQFEIVSLLGVGSWGAVFKARQVAVNRYVAVKMLHAHLVADIERAERFKREAETVSKLNHPHITTIYDFGQVLTGQPYLVLEFLPGINLNTALEAEHHLSVDQAMPIFRQICDGLQAAHEQSIVHRDLKPANIRLLNGSTSGAINLKIMDFGLARLAGDVALNDRVTRTGQVLGTPEYMSPEQCRGEPVDERADIYSLGCVMYEVLTGKPLVSGTTLNEIMHQHINHEVKAFPTTGTKIPPGLEAIIRKALSKDRERRFQTAHELKQALNNFGMGQLTGADDPGISIKLPSINTAVGVTLALVAVIAVVGLAGWVYYKNNANPLPLHADEGATQSGGLPEVRRKNLNELLSTKVRGQVLDLHSQGLADVDVMYIVDEIIARKLPINAIELRDNHISDHGVEALAKVPGLVGAGLRANDVTDDGVAALNSTPISWVNIETTLVKGACFANGFKRLRNILVYSGGFEPASLKFIGKLPMLEALELGGTKTTDEDLRFLTGAHELSNLGLYGTEVSDGGLRYLRGLPLRRLYLCGTKARGIGLTNVQDAPLTSLGLPDLSDNTLTFVCLFPKLSTFEFDPNPGLTPVGIKKLQMLKQLYTLKVREAPTESDSLNDDCLEAISKIPTIRDLQIRSAVITDAGLMNLKKTRLISLGLRCKRVTPDGISLLKRYLRNCAIRQLPEE